MLSDIHGSAAYRANLVKVMAKRAVAAAAPRTHGGVTHCARAAAPGGHVVGRHDHLLVQRAHQGADRGGGEALARENPAAR